MNFIVTESSYAVTNYPNSTIVLVRDNWNDWWEYTTLYGMHYCTADNIEWIGTVKIGQIGLTPDENKHVGPDLPDEFPSLDERFFSIGQDVSYYNNLNELGEDVRLKILKGINDLALKEDLFNKVKHEHVMRRSLLRYVSTVSVEGQYRKLANGNAELCEYFFEYFLPENKTNSSLTVHVVPNCFPPSNIHVLIGRNGVGKTNLIRNLINCNITNDSTYGELNTTIKGELFASIISVSFSVFENEEIYEVKNQNNFKFYRIGLLKEIKEVEEPKFSEKYKTKSFEELVSEFIDSLKAINAGAKVERWKRTINYLNSDPIFSDIGIESLIDNENIGKARLIFEKLSSGHKIVLLTLTNLVEKVEERTLVILDEPELHLHPPLLSAFVRALSDLMIYRNAVALIATHSPVIVQEVPSNCVKIMDRTGYLVSFSEPDIQTFGENISSLTREIFNLEVKKSGFHRILIELVKEGLSYEEIMTKLNNNLGLEGKTLLRSMLFSKKGKEN